MSKGVKMCKNFFYIFLHFSNISKNKIEPTSPIEPIELKLDFSHIFDLFKLKEFDSIIQIRQIKEKTSKVRLEQITVKHR